MKVFIQTDMECTAGIVNFVDYCLPPESRKYAELNCGRGKYYEHGKHLVTMEVNAAVEGLLEGGATEILVSDSHGFGGLHASEIHSAARVLTGANLPIFEGLDESCDAAIMIGQHAKANTDGGHLAHSGSFSREDWILNGKSIGEIEWFLIAAAYHNVPVVLISGDVAACCEARELIPSIETVEVIEGVKFGSQARMTPVQAINLNVAAVHTSPEKAREWIKKSAKKCLRKVDSIKRYWVEPPYEMIRITRAWENASACKCVKTNSDYMTLIRDTDFEYTQIENYPA